MISRLANAFVVVVVVVEYAFKAIWSRVMNIYIAYVKRRFSGCIEWSGIDHQYLISEYKSHISMRCHLDYYVFSILFFFFPCFHVSCQVTSGRNKYLRDSVYNHNQYCSVAAIIRSTFPRWTDLSTFNFRFLIDKTMRTHEK